MKRVLLILSNGNLMAQDYDGKCYVINGLVIPKHSGVPDAFYDKGTSFFKAACPEGTQHNADEVTKGIVNLY